MGLPALQPVLSRNPVLPLVILGLAVRTYHYARNPSMWHDEAALVLNVLNKNLLELLGPLGYHEAAPPLFLWLERGAALLLGDSTFALRLIPYLSSCAALLLMVSVAHRALSSAAVPWAILLMACSDHLLWHTCEAKPYATDVLAAAGVLALYFHTPSWSLGLRLAAAVGIAPWLIFLAYPGCFLCGGLLSVLLLQVWQARHRSVRVAYGFFVLVVFAAFTLVLVGPAHAQRSAEMLSCWVQTWPRWDKPWSIPFWTLIQALEVFRYAFEPAGQGLCLLALFGVLSFWRRRAREQLVFLLVPPALALLAAYLHAYPFGGYRVVVFTAPALALLIAEGAAVTLNWLTRKRWEALSGTPCGDSSGDVPGGGGAPRCLSGLCRIGSAALVLFLFLPLARVLHRVWIPWPRPDSARAADFILSHRQAGDPVVGNHWEYAYYFRRLEPPFRLLPEARFVPGTRLWLATTSGDPNDRLALATTFPGHWHVQEQQDFLQCTVFFLSRPGPVGERFDRPSSPDSGPSWPPSRASDCPAGELRLRR